MSTAQAITPRGAGRLVGVRRFTRTENASAGVLLAATVAALAWANSPWSASYDDLWGPSSRSAWAPRSSSSTCGTG